MLKLIGLGIIGLVALVGWNYWPGADSSEVDQLPPEQTWISPGKYYVEGLHPGASADIPVAVFNGNEEDTTFEITVRQPSSPKPPYEPWPWPESVVVSTPEPTLIPGEVKPIAIELSMPEGVEYEEKMAEIWVSVIEQGQEGMVITELVTRVLIETR